jgi:hypothetical protein
MATLKLKIDKALEVPQRTLVVLSPLSYSVDHINRCGLPVAQRGSNQYGLPVLTIGLYLRVGLDGVGWDDRGKP